MGLLTRRHMKPLAIAPNDRPRNPARPIAVLFPLVLAAMAGAAQVGHSNDAASGLDPDGPATRGGGPAVSGQFEYSFVDDNTSSHWQIVGIQTDPPLGGPVWVDFSAVSKHLTPFPGNKEWTSDLFFVLKRVGENWSILVAHLGLGLGSGVWNYRVEVEGEGIDLDIGSPRPSTRSGGTGIIEGRLNLARYSTGDLPNEFYFVKANPASGYRYFEVTVTSSVPLATAMNRGPLEDIELNDSTDFEGDTRVRARALQDLVLLNHAEIGATAFRNLSKSVAVENLNFFWFDPHGFSWRGTAEYEYATPAGDKVTGTAVHGVTHSEGTTPSLYPHFGIGGPGEWDYRIHHLTCVDEVSWFCEPILVRLDAPLPNLA